MAESSGFFDAEELVDGGYDREYVAEQWANYFKLFIGNGVFANPANTLKVIAGSGLTVKVLPGWAWINGYWYHNDSELTLEIPTNLTLSTIQDGIFLRFDSANRVISALVGVNRTTVNRISPYYELKLAEVTVDVGVTSISDANITDTRTDSSVCGIVAGVINQIDTTDLFAQYQAAFNAFMQGSGTEFETWFDHMKDQLDTDAAGHLQAEVDEINEIIAPVQLTLTASQPYAIGEQFIYEGKLYTATSAIAQNDTIVIGTNASLSAEIVKQIKSAKDAIGNLASLTTDAKSNSVAAINEVNTKVSKTEVLISIVENGNTCTHKDGIAQGQYVNWKGSLYTADSNISVGATFASSGGSKNLSAVADGGLNELNGKFSVIKNSSYTTGQISSANIIKNTSMKFAEIDILFKNLTSGSTSWQTVSTNSEVFPVPITPIYGSLAFDGKGDFRIMSNPFSIDVNLRGGTDTTPTLHAMYFYQ